MTVRVFAQQSGVTEEDLRLGMAAGYAQAGALNARSGIIPAGGSPADLVTVSALAAKVTPFQAVIDGTSTAFQGAYLLTSDSDVTLNFGAGSGANPRIDLVVLRVRDNPYDASASQTGTVEIVAGTPSGTPIVPNVPPNSLPLWQVAVPANASGSTPLVFTTARTDRRVYTAATGAPVPVANVAARDAVVSPYKGMPCWRLDTSWLEVYDGTAWRVQGVAAVASAAARSTLITAPYDGQLALTANDNVLWVYDVSATPSAAWVPTSGVWSTYTPVWTASTSNPAIGNGVITGQVARVGNIVHCRGWIQIGSSTSFGAGIYSISLPVPADITLAQVPHFGAWIRDSSPQSDHDGYALLATSTTFQIRGPSTTYGGSAVWAQAAPITLAAGDWASWSFSYPAA